MFELFPGTPAVRGFEDAAARVAGRGIAVDSRIDDVGSFRIDRQGANIAPAPHRVGSRDIPGQAVCDGFERRPSVVAEHDLIAILFGPRAAGAENALRSVDRVDRHSPVVAAETIGKSQRPKLLPGFPVVAAGEDPFVHGRHKGSSIVELNVGDATDVGPAIALFPSLAAVFADGRTPVGLMNNSSGLCGLIVRLVGALRERVLFPVTSAGSVGSAGRLGLSCVDFAHVWPPSWEARTPPTNRWPRSD